MDDIRTPSVPALERALSILELLAFVRHGLTLPDLSRRLELPKSSAHCLLVTLERRGYLQVLGMPRHPEPGLLVVERDGGLEPARHGVGDIYVEQGTQAQIRRRLGLDSEGIEAAASEFIKSTVGEEAFFEN